MAQITFPPLLTRDDHHQVAPWTNTRAILVGGLSMATLITGAEYPQVAGILRLHEAAMPQDAACPEQPALQLYGTPMEALIRLGQHFLTEGETVSDAAAVA